MFKRALLALALVGMVATPALADLLVPDTTRNPAHIGAGTIGVFGASVNGVPFSSPGFLGAGGGVASQVSIPANVSDTLMITFAFHWPFNDQATSPYLPYLGVQFWTRLNYDNSEVQVTGATGAGVFSAVNFGIGASNSKMVANGPTTTTTTGTAMNTNMIPGTSTMIGINGTPLKGFPNPSSGIISTAPGFGRFAVNPATTKTLMFTTPTAGGATTDKGMIIPFSSTFPIMKVTLHVKNVAQDGLVDLVVPPNSAALLFRSVVTSTVMNTNPFTGGMSTTTMTSILPNLYYTGFQVGAVGDFGASIVPEPASAALMGIGLFSLVGGFWRRRRRMSL